MNILSTEDIAVLNQARTILTAAGREADAQAWHLAPEPRYSVTPQGLGRFAEAAHRAESAIFNVLNVGENYARISMTDDELHNRTTEEVAA